MNNHNFFMRFFLLILFLSVCALAPAAARPAWVDKQPADTAETVYFRGIADGADSREKAEQSAVQNLHALVSSTIMVSVSSSVREQTKTVQRGTSGVITEHFKSELDTEIESHTAMLLSGIKAETYSEAAASGRWRAWALGAVSRKQLEAEIAEYPGKISGQYSRLIASGGSMAADIRNRQGIMQTLDKNPLHKAAAYFERPEGRVNLYDYLAAQINTWAGSIAVAPVPGQKAQKGETIDLPISVSSTLYQSLGQLEYRVSFFRPNSKTAAVTYTVSGENNFMLPLRTAGIGAGNYLVRLEPAFAGAQGPRAEFPFEVAAIAASFHVDFTGSMPENFGKAEQARARETIQQALQQGIQRNNLPITLGSGGDYQFTVTADMQQFPNLTRCAVTVAFQQQAETLAQSKSQNKGERDINLLFGRFVRDAIANDQEFFAAVNALFP